MEQGVFEPGVFPTRVGVYRLSRAHRAWYYSFSPHAWGCTALVHLFGDDEDGFPHTRGGVPERAWAADFMVGVFPTRVGVYRLVCL